MKKGFIFLCWLVLLVIMSCVSASFRAGYEDEAITAELVVDDNDWVVLTITNNTTSPIQLLTDKAHYSNTGGNGENTILVPLQENMNPGTKVVPIPIPPGRRVVQRFVAPGYVKYKRGQVDNIDNWAPRGKNIIKTASFDFEYEIEGETKHFIFEGEQFS